MARRLLGVLLASILALAIAPQVCLACSCMLLPPDEAIAKADIIFKGSVIRRASQGFRGYAADGSFTEMAQLTAVFNVFTVWKGPAVPQLSIAQGVVANRVAAPNIVSSSSCEVSFYPGREYLVFATWQTGARDRPPVLVAYSCDATRETSQAVDYLQVLGPGTSVGSQTLALSGPGHGAALGAYEIASPAATRATPHPALNPPERPAAVFGDFGFSGSALTVDRDGYIYALDYAADSSNRHRILKFAPDGELVAIWASRAKSYEIDEFYSVRSLAVDRQGNVYVSPLGGARKLNASGQLIADWRLRPNADRADDGLLLIDGAGELIVVADTRGVRRFAPDGDLLATWPAADPRAANGYSASGAALDGQGNLYVTSSSAHSVRKFSPTGELLAEWGRRGAGPGEFQYPWGIGVDPWGNVYVADSGNDRVQQFSPSGAFVAAWGGAGSTPGQFRRPAGIAIDRRGGIFVVDGGNFRIQRIPAAGR